MAQESDAEGTLLRWVDTLTQLPVGEEALPAVRKLGVLQPSAP
ncbi:hypothetical protein OHV13_34570 [Kitasatospora purpeofusca]